MKNPNACSFLNFSHGLVHHKLQHVLEKEFYMCKKKNKTDCILPLVI